MSVLLQVAQALAGLRADMTADAEAVHANFVQQLMAGRRDAAAAIAQEHSELAAELQALGQQLNAALAGQQAKLTALVEAEVHQVGRAGPPVGRAADDRALTLCSGLHWVLARTARAGQLTKPSCSLADTLTFTSDPSMWPHLFDCHNLSHAGPPSVHNVLGELLSSSFASRKHSASSPADPPSLRAVVPTLSLWSCFAAPVHLASTVHQARLPRQA